MGYPGSLKKHDIYFDKYPEEEYDSNGIPFGIQIDYDRPFLDTQGNTRSVFVYRPSTLNPSYLAKSVTILCDFTEKSEIESLLIESGLMYLAEREGAFLIFALPSPDGWNSMKEPSKPDDVAVLAHMLNALREGFLFPGREKCIGYYMGMIGVGKGAEMAHVTLAEEPSYVATLLTFGGNITSQMLSDGCEDAELFVWIVNAKGDADIHWKKINGLEQMEEKLAGDTKIVYDEKNHAKQVRVTKNDKGGFDAKFVYEYWQDAFLEIVRTAGTGNGSVVSCAQIHEEYQPCVHKSEISLGDNEGVAHNWIEFVPQSVKDNRFTQGFSCPLLVVLHGGGCSPDSEIAVFNAHELGEEDGFITVYANATLRNSWNSFFVPSQKSDVEHIVALIEYMKQHYPIDPSRVYLTGFSNGSGMSQVIAALKPELIAGIITFNTRFAIDDSVIEKVKKVKQNFDYRMPVYSTYGTCDFEYPMFQGCGQFTQMKFWKWFNNIEAKELDPNDPSGIGAPGNEIEKWGPLGESGDPIFTTHKFFNKEENSINYYNYTLIEGLPHAVEKRVMRTAWDFVSRFSRKPNGDLAIHD